VLSSSEPCVAEVACTGTYGETDSVTIQKRKIFAALLTAAFVTMAYAPASQAFKFGDMMNPGKWMGGNKDYDDYDDYGPGPDGPYGPGPGGPAPYGGTPYGGAPYGTGPVGAPGGYAPPGSYGRAPTAAAPPAPQPSVDQSGRIRELEQRIDQLEAEMRRQQPTPSPSRPSTPTYRPYRQ
jgi:hypothetical protein